MDISILLSKSEMSKKIKLIIKPLAPLSMISEVPGTYYKTQDTPDKFKLCGLFENILGWHFSKMDRDKIIKQLKANYKKYDKAKEFEIKQSNSSYQPLLFDFFEIAMVYKSESINYNDLWKRSFSRRDEDVHPKGTPNLNYQKLKEKHIFLKDSSLKDFYRNNLSYFPMFYTTPTLREYIDYMGNDLKIILKMNNNLFELLSNALLVNSSAYLGNSESWVEINIEEL